MAEEFGHQDPSQMRLEDFYGHDVNTEEEPQEEYVLVGLCLIMAMVVGRMNIKAVKDIAKQLKKMKAKGKSLTQRH